MVDMLLIVGWVVSLCVVVMSIMILVLKAAKILCEEEH